MTYSPWAAVAAWPEISVLFVDMPSEEMGWWDESTRTIELNCRLGRIERRTTLAHELVHAERGDQACVAPELEARQELAVAKEAARRLIDIHRLADVASALPDDAHRVAEELDVDYDTLATRMRWLHPSERHYLQRRMSAREDQA